MIWIVLVVGDTTSVGCFVGEGISGLVGDAHPVNSAMISKINRETLVDERTAFILLFTALPLIERAIVHHKALHFE